MTSFVEVATFGEYGVQRVPMPKSKKVGDVLQQVYKQLSLKPISHDCFSLFAGPLGLPTLRLDSSDSVTGHDRLCLQRFGVGFTKEHKVLTTDHNAVHLLFSEVLVNYRRENSSLQPTTEQRKLLEEYLDPNFVCERQFVELAQTIPGYNSVQFEGTVVRSPIQNDSCTIPVNCKVLCTCSEGYLEVRAENGHQTKWKWQTVRRWKLETPDSDTAVFEVTNIKGNAHMLELIYIHTKRASYMLQTALSFCNELLYKSDPTKRRMAHEGLKAAQQPMIGRPVDNLYNFVNTALFGSGPQFTDIAKTNNNN